MVHTRAPPPFLPKENTPICTNFLLEKTRPPPLFFFFLQKTRSVPILTEKNLHSIFYHKPPLARFAGILVSLWGFFGKFRGVFSASCGLFLVRMRGYFGKNGGKGIVVRFGFFLVNPF